MNEGGFFLVRGPTSLIVHASLTDVNVLVDEKSACP